jgi:hypothetical protein
MLVTFTKKPPIKTQITRGAAIGVGGSRWPHGHIDTEALGPRGTAEL